MSETASPTAPLTVGEAGQLFAPLRAAPRLVVAVSGGPDSIAMMHLAALAFREGLLPPFVAATVDHGLQPASRDIAARVVAQADGLGIEAHHLVWEGPKPKTGLQEAARQERYRLLDALAQRLDGAHLLTAHSLDDQAETILFRMARGSGPAGLAGMRPTMMREGITHHRPFLGIGKRRLVETCRLNGWSFVEDPANCDPRFTRARLRGLMPMLAREGLDAQTLVALGHRLSRDEAALSAIAAEALGAMARTSEDKRKVIDASMLRTHPPAIALRILDRMMTDFARSGAPRLGRLERLVEDLTGAYAARRSLRRTLHGHIVTLDADGSIEIKLEGTRNRGLAGAA